VTKHLFLISLAITTQSWCHWPGISCLEQLNRTEAGSALVLVSHDARLAGHFARQIDLPALNRAAAPGGPR